MFANRIVTLGILIAFSAGLPAAHAQESRASVIGRVTDSSGAVIPAASVSFANLETGKEELQIPLPNQPVSVTLSADGKYAFSAVQADDKIFVIPLATRRIEKIIQTPKGAGPDPYLFIR